MTKYLQRVALTWSKKSIVKLLPRLCEVRDITLYKCFRALHNINIAQQWLRSWLVAWLPKAITWANIDLSSKVFCDTLPAINYTGSARELKSKLMIGDNSPLKLLPYLPGTINFTLFCSFQVRYSVTWFMTRFVHFYPPGDILLT